MFFPSYECDFFSPPPGGTRGFDKHVWQVDGFKAADEAEQVAEGKGPEDVILKELTLSTFSEDGDQGEKST